MINRDLLVLSTDDHYVITTEAFDEAGKEEYKYGDMLIAAAYKIAKERGSVKAIRDGKLQFENVVSIEDEDIRNAVKVIWE